MPETPPRKSATASGRQSDVADHRNLLHWYRANRRDLPWRRNRDPYRIWISEVMLQQTTVAAVIPYYERFLAKFPDVHTLAAAPESAVLEAWAGLGYYSRARNLHRASKELAKNGFPRTAAELEEFPGFGPYTSRAVASIAFDDKVGVLDGNVIRVLSRKNAVDVAWWTPAGRRDLQRRADDLATLGDPADLNQALMELGATVCTPSSPACLLCPWSTTCEGRKSGDPQQWPTPRPRRATEIWLWEVELSWKKGHVALVQNPDSPVLRGQWIFPGQFRKLTTKPKTFHVRHGITHHDLYVKVVKVDEKADGKRTDVRWQKPVDLPGLNPSKLLTKILAEGKIK